MRDELIEERLTHSVIGGFYDSYNQLGFGFLESLCVKALVIELVERGHCVATEVNVPVFYRGQELEALYTLAQAERDPQRPMQVFEAILRD